MLFAFICAIIAYFGLIRFQIRLYRRNQLTEAFFEWSQVAILGALLVSGSVAFLPTNEEQLIGIGISFLCALAGIPLTRWFFKKFLQHK
jgi:hypothetical protein